VRRLARPQAHDVLFIDVGNVLFHDAPIELAFSYFVHQELVGPEAEEDWTPLALLERTRQSSRSATLERAVGVVWAEILRRWSELAVPVPGSLEALQALAGVRMAILANQPRETLAVLETWGAMPRFDAVFLDSLVGLGKPDPAFFRHALASLEVSPQQAWMLGDREDNDLIPAGSLGMRTVWIRPPPLEAVDPLGLIPESWRAAYLEDMRRAATRSAPCVADCAFDSLVEFARWVAPGRSVVPRRSR
jgi:HAD superfamily hydrolase (TIGR01509 family)